MASKPKPVRSVVLDEELLDALEQWLFGEDMVSQDPMLERIMKPPPLPRGGYTHGKRRGPLPKG